MCQWKFLVFTYSANTSARMAFIVPVMSLVAACDRSVRVASGASRLCASSKRFLESSLFIVLAPSFFDRFEFIRCFFMVVARALPQSHYRQGVAVEVASRPQAVGDLITPDGFLQLRAQRTVCFAAIVTFSSESLLRCDNDRIV